MERLSYRCFYQQFLLIMTAGEYATVFLSADSLIYSHNSFALRDSRFPDGIQHMKGETNVLS